MFFFETNCEFSSLFWNILVRISMDGVFIHKKEVKKILLKKGFVTIFLPLNSPKLNQIDRYLTNETIVLLFKTPSILKTLILTSKIF